MKKLFYSLFALAMTFTSCEDVPAPYDDPNKSSDNSNKIEGAIPYTSLNLYTGWTLHKISADEPWSQGNSYTQATGYQKWEGADQKSNRAVEGYLISPKFNTLGSEHVKISFDQTIRYTNNVSGWADFHKIFVSTNYDGNNFDNAIWQEVNFKPVSSPYSDWTLYTSGEIQLPEEVADKENVYVAFWFKAPENASTTWELQNFKIEAGIAEESPENPAAKEITCAEAIELTNALDDNATSAEAYVVTGYITQVVGNVSSGQQSFWMADTKDGGKMFEAYYANLPEGVSEFKNGSKVKITGNLTKYVKDGKVTAEMKNPTVEILEAGEGGGGGGGTGDAKGSGMLADPYNPAGAIAAVANLTWTSNDNYQTTGDVYVKGKISRIADKGTFTEGGSYGNSSFYISEDGTQNGEFYCFRILYLGNKKFESGNTDIKVGDEVIVCGQLMNYRGNTPETVAGKAYLYSLNGKSEGGGGGGGATGEAKGSGTLADPYNPVGAAAAVASLTWTSNTEYQTTGDVYVKGKISRIADKGTFTEGGSYGNSSFYISEDGTQNGEFYCFRILYLGNKKFESGQTDIKVGDEVIIYGKLMNYRGNTPETVANQTYLYSLNGKSEGGGGGEQPSGAGTYDSPLTVSQAIALGSADAAWVKGYIVGYVKGSPTQLSESDVFFTTENATNTNILIAASASEGDVSKCMPVQLTRNKGREEFELDTNPDMLKKEVILAGQLTKYFGVPGLKNLTYIEGNGKSVGNKVMYRKRK